MSLEKLLVFAKDVRDLADKPNSTMTAEQLKAWFDSAPEELRVKYNTLVDELVANTGATNIGAKDEAGVTTNVQAQLDKIGIENRMRYLDAVATVALRDSTYPTPTHGDTVRVTTPEEGLARTYRFVTGSGWVVTDVYNPTAIDEVNAKLADAAVDLESVASALASTDIKVQEIDTVNAANNVNLETFLIELDAIRSIVNAQSGTSIESGTTTFLAE